LCISTGGSPGGDDGGDGGCASGVPACSLSRATAPPPAVFLYAFSGKVSCIAISFGRYLVANRPE